jgi:hypothetical protein
MFNPWLAISLRAVRLGLETQSTVIGGLVRLATPRGALQSPGARDFVDRSGEAAASHETETPKAAAPHKAAAPQKPQAAAPQKKERATTMAVPAKKVMKVSRHKARSKRKSKR